MRKDRINHILEEADIQVKMSEATTSDDARKHYWPRLVYLLAKALIYAIQDSYIGFE